MPGCSAADDPSGGACQVRTTGQGFPAHCAAQLAAAHKNILFLGNSYTTTNNLPGVLSSLAAAAGGAGMEGRRHYLTWECGAGLSCNTSVMAGGGLGLGDHVASADTLARLRAGGWDAVVLQDQSQRPSWGHHYVSAGA